MHEPLEASAAGRNQSRRHSPATSSLSRRFDDHPAREASSHWVAPPCHIVAIGQQVDGKQGVPGPDPDPNPKTSCDPVPLDSGLGKLAARHPDVLVQSHISESHDAVAFSAALHPQVDGRDAQLFEAAGLLTSPVRRLAAHWHCVAKQQLRLAPDVLPIPAIWHALHLKTLSVHAGFSLDPDLDTRCITDDCPRVMSCLCDVCQAVFAHAVCLTDDELRLMAERGSAIAHCPLSNFFFADRLLRYKHMQCAMYMSAGCATQSRLPLFRRHLFKEIAADAVPIVGPQHVLCAHLTRH